MANMSLEERNRTGTTLQRVPEVSILEQTGEVLTQASEDPANVPNQGVVMGREHIQEGTNIFRRILASHTARRLFILFDVVATILLIVLLGDGEDDLRLHASFVQSIQGWRRE